MDRIRGQHKVRQGRQRCFGHVQRRERRSIEDEDGAAKEEEKMKASGGVHGSSEGRRKDRLRQSQMIHCGEP